MWVCNTCGHVFTEPEEYYERDTGYYGTECPHCFCDDIDEAEQCVDCGKWVNEKKLVNGYCEACVERHASDYETVKEYGAGITDTVTINGLFAWAFSVSEIEEILEKILIESDKVQDYARRYATNDTDDFTQWLKKEDEDGVRDN